MSLKHVSVLFDLLFGVLVYLFVMFLHGVLRPRGVRALRTAGQLVHPLARAASKPLAVVPKHQPDPLRREVARGALDGRQSVEQLQVGVVFAVARVEVARQREPQARLVVAFRAPVTKIDLDY